MTQPANKSLTRQDLEKLKGTLKAEMTQEMLDTINASDTFKGLMRQAIDQGLVLDIDYRSGRVGAGEYQLANDEYPAGLLTMTPDLLKDTKTFLTLFGHELGHFGFESRGRQPDIETKFAEHIAQRNASEAHGDAVAAQIGRELAGTDHKIFRIGASHERIDELAKTYGDQSLASTHHGVGNTAEAVAANYRLFEYTQGKTYLRKYVDEYNETQYPLIGNEIIRIKYFKEDGTVLERSLLGDENIVQPSLGDTTDFVRAELIYAKGEKLVSSLKCNGKSVSREGGCSAVSAPRPASQQILLGASGSRAHGAVGR